MKLRADVRRFCWQLLGPPPEQYDTFYRCADGSPGPQHTEKMASLGVQEQPTGKPKNAPRKRRVKA